MCPLLINKDIFPAFSEFENLNLRLDSNLAMSRPPKNTMTNKAEYERPTTVFVQKTDFNATEKRIPEKQSAGSPTTELA